jgi:hypothetical protein
MTSPAPPPTKTEGRVHLVAAALLAPSVLGFLCSIFCQANPGGAWWLFRGFGNVLGVLGLAFAVLSAPRCGWAPESDTVAHVARNCRGRGCVVILLKESWF